MDKSKLKIIGFLFGGLFIVCILVLLLNNPLNDNNTNTPSYENNNDNNSNVNPSTPKIYDYLIISNTDMFRVDNGKFKRLDKLQNVSQQFYTYVDGRYLGKYNLKLGKVWNLFNNNGKYVSYEGNLFAYTGNDLNINVRNIEYTTINNSDLNEIINEMGMKIDINTLFINEKISVDIDSNGIVDEIISVSNAEISDNNNLDKYFNLVYVKLNGIKEVIIKEDIAIEDLMKSPSYHINYLLNINNINSILIEEGYFSEGGNTKNIMYQLIDDKFTLIVK